MSVIVTASDGLFIGNKLTMGSAVMSSTPTLIDGNTAASFGISAHIVDSSSVGLDLGSGKTIDYFQLYDDAGISGTMTHGSIIIGGSNDNNTWTQVGAELHYPGAGTGIVHSDTTHISTITPTVNNVAYRYWRIYFSGAMGPSSGYYTFTELQAFGPAPPPGPEARVSLPFDVTKKSGTVRRFIVQLTDNTTTWLIGNFAGMDWVNDDPLGPFAPYSGSIYALCDKFSFGSSTDLMENTNSRATTTLTIANTPYKGSVRFSDEIQYIVAKPCAIYVTADENQFRLLNCDRPFLGIVREVSEITDTTMKITLEDRGYLLDKILLTKQIRDEV